MEELDSKMIIRKKFFNDLKEITQNLYNIVGAKRVKNIAPEILDEIGMLSNMIHNEMENEDVTIIHEFPFEIGTYLKRKKCLVDHIDQLKEYIVKQDGIYAVIVLNSLTDRSKDSEIPLEKLLDEWIIATEREIKHEEGIQRIMKK